MVPVIMDLEPVGVIRDLNLNHNIWLLVEVLLVLITNNNMRQKWDCAVSTLVESPLDSRQDNKQTLTKSTQAQPCLQTKRLFCQAHRQMSSLALRR